MRTGPGRGELSVRPLSRSTWPDFERFFRKYHGVQAGCWCMFYRRDRPVSAPTEAARQEINRRDREELVRSGASDGVLVYASGEAVGWCQFGRREELPRLERGRKYGLVPAARPGRPLWRITCFFVDRPYRRRGVAKLALDAALREIRRRGGGIVEAFPTTNPGAVALWFGTVSMFRREGFHKVAKFGRSHLLVRRLVRAPGRGASRRARTSRD